jgi:hypothetical protein
VISIDGARLGRPQDQVQHPHGWKRSHDRCLHWAKAPQLDTALRGDLGRHRLPDISPKVSLDEIQRLPVVLEPARSFAVLHR